MASIDTISAWCDYRDTEYIENQPGWLSVGRDKGIYVPLRNRISKDLRVVYVHVAGKLIITFEFYKILCMSPFAVFKPEYAASLIKQLDLMLSSLGLRLQLSSAYFQVTRYDVRLFGKQISLPEYKSFGKLFLGVPPNRKGDKVFIHDSSGDSTWYCRGRAKRRSGLTTYAKGFTEGDEYVIPQLEAHFGGPRQNRELIKRLNDGNRDLLNVLSNERLPYRMFHWGIKRFGMIDYPIIESRDLVAERISTSKANSMWKTYALDWLYGRASTKKSYFKDIQNRYGRTVSFVDGRDSVDLNEIFDFAKVIELAG